MKLPPNLDKPPLFNSGYRTGGSESLKPVNGDSVPHVSGTVAFGAQVSDFKVPKLENELFFTSGLDPPSFKRPKFADDSHQPQIHLVQQRDVLAVRLFSNQKSTPIVEHEDDHVHDEDVPSTTGTECITIESHFNPFNEPSPLGLHLRKSPSLLDLIQRKLAQTEDDGSERFDQGGNLSRLGSLVSPADKDKLKAANFPASKLRIGEWEVNVPSSYLVRNGSITLLHLQHKPWKVLSKGPKSRIGCAYKKSWGLESHLLEGVHKSLGIRKFSLSSIISRVQDKEASEWEREEARWLREEKRWLREEERWLREEARWAAKCKELLEQALISEEQIKALKIEISQLKSRVKDEEVKDETISDLIVRLTSLLHSLNMATSPGTEDQGSSFQAQISSSASTLTDISKALGGLSLEIPTKSIEMVASASQPSILELVDVPTALSRSGERKKRVLKRGAEGDEVKAMQEALAKLGFYSGDEDMEYSTFSSGTDRAVRSWQAAVGALEDGIVTTELLIKLLGEETPERKASSSPSQVSVMPSAKAVVSESNAGGKGATSEVKTGGTVKAGAGTDKPTGLKADFSSPKKPLSNGVEAPQRRVYLLGENRWEEPDRLLSKNGPAVTTAVTKMLGEKCFSCKGQGSMMCTGWYSLLHDELWLITTTSCGAPNAGGCARMHMHHFGSTCEIKFYSLGKECEGTGQLNVEEQFLEWADEDAKCPYCEGKGVLDCDVCDGKGVKALA